MNLDDIHAWLENHDEEIVDAFRGDPGRRAELSTVVDTDGDPDHVVRRVIDALLGWPVLGNRFPRGFNAYLRRSRAITPAEYSEALRRNVEVLSFVRNKIIEASSSPPMKRSDGANDAAPPPPRRETE